ncbi:hypothetical protein CsSME_00009025 [Camellia sinensis var. sinensis]
MASSCSFYAPSVSCSWHLFHSHGTCLTQRRSEVLCPVLLLASSLDRFLTAVSPITGKKAKTLADRDGTTPSSFSVRGVGVAIDRIIVVKEAPSLLKRAEVAMFAALMPATERAFAYTTSHSEWGSLPWFNVGSLSKEWF